MKWELGALKILAQNTHVPGVALQDVITELEREQAKLALTQKILTEIKSELAAATARAKTCEDALISMVQQYCRYSDEEDKYSHDFMSASEEAFSYLVGNGLARWTDDRHAFIEFPKGGEL